MRAIDFRRDVVELVCGKGHGLKVGVIADGPDEMVEIIGHLPSVLRKGLSLAFAAWEAPRPGWAPWGGIVWHLSPDGYGPRYAVPSADALVGLLAARREALAGGAA